MKLGVKERLLLGVILPAEGNITTVRTLTELRNALYFTGEEVEKFGVQQKDQSIVWDSSKEKEVEIPINGLAKSLIVDTLQKLDADKKLTADHMSLWDKFVESTDEAKTST
jgi:hypothetical protein